MNARKCKAIRRAVRLQGFDPLETKYLVVQTGAQKWNSGSRQLAKQCGRGIYKRIKKEMAL